MDGSSLTNVPYNINICTSDITTRGTDTLVVISHISKFLSKCRFFSRLPRPFVFPFSHFTNSSVLPTLGSGDHLPVWKLSFFLRLSNTVRPFSTHVRVCEVPEPLSFDSWVVEVGTGDERTTIYSTPTDVNRSSVLENWTLYTGP